MMLAWLCLTTALGSIAVEHVQAQLGDGRVIDNATVVWNNGVITAVSTTPAPADAQRVDGQGKILTPGLIEARTRLGLSEVDQEETTSDFSPGKDPATPAFHAADGYNPASVRIPLLRREGITSVITAPGAAEQKHARVLFGTGSWVDLPEGVSPGPLPPVAMYGDVGHDAADSVGGSRGGIWLLLRTIVEDARFYGKSQVNYDHGASRDLVLRPAHLRAMQPVLAGKLPLVVNAERLDDILRAVDFAHDEGIRLIISGGAEAWQAVRKLAERRVGVLLRPSTQQPNTFDELHAREDAATLLLRAGVPVVLSAGYENQDIVRLRQEAGIAVSMGMPHGAALSAITLVPAQVFGKDRSVGSISVGKRANLVLWSGDPFETSTLAEKVWIDGTLQSQRGRQDALVHRYLQRTKASTADKKG